jgi:LCP family protein required for cell wall assembly
MTEFPSEGPRSPGRAPAPRAPSTVLSGLLLGFLLLLFLAAFGYVAHLFFSWGQSVVAGLPELPPLALPRLVRPADVAAAGLASAADRRSQPASAGQRATSAGLAGRVTVLLMGVDNRPDEPVARTDSIMVLTLNPQTGSAGMLSLPRDLLVHVSALNRDVKINTVHVLGEINGFPGGGPELLRETVEELIGHPIDYYASINFDGFRQIIDLIGGIDIVVPKTIDDPLYPDENYGYDPLYIPAGLHHMDGALALKYARTRHVDSDYGRAARQQQVIMAVKEKVTQPGQLAALLPRLPGLALAMAGMIQTDMPLDKALALARLMGEVDLQNPIRVVVDNTMGQETTDPVQGFILIPDMAKLRAAVETVFADMPELSQEERVRQQLQAEAARIVVLNGTREEGLAARTQALLMAEGFNVTAVGNAERADYAQTWLITHGDSAPFTRELLIQRFAISPERILSEPPSDSADLTLIVGQDQMASSP